MSKRRRSSVAPPSASVKKMRTLTKRHPNQRPCPQSTDFTATFFDVKPANDPIQIVGCLRFVGGSPTFRHYAALHAGPRTSLVAGAGLSSSLRSSSTRAVGLCVAWRRLRALVLWGESQSQERLRRAGSESRGVALSGCGSRCWPVGSGRVLPSPGPGGNQEPAGSATGDSFGWW